MRRRYTIHRDGDLLVEDLDASGKPIEPEPVPQEDRKPIIIELTAPDDVDSKAELLDLLEMALDMELNGPDEGGPPPKIKLDVLS
jgi:hypothetical protein